MARAFGSYPKCHRFESSRRYHDPHRVSPWRVGQAAKTPPFHGGNTGSIPVRVTTDGWNRSRPFGGLAQLVRAPASHAGGHWFESSSLHQKHWKFQGISSVFICFFNFSVYLPWTDFWPFSIDHRNTTDRKTPASAGVFSFALMPCLPLPGTASAPPGSPPS